MPAADPVDAMRAAARPLTGHAADYDELLEVAGKARVVLLGEATHGTHEFYHERARLTQRLVAEMGFTVVAVEADWPEAYRVNRFVRGATDDGSASEALEGFRAFPGWMWRNAEVLALVDWLREYNDSLPVRAPRVGVYGLDLYSAPHPGAAGRVDPRTVPVGSRVPEDEVLLAEQNARLARVGEAFRRAMLRGGPASWNLRDRHMAETLDALVRHLDGRVGRARVVVWAHNAHVGDARGTEMGDEGRWTLGQLARERWGPGAILVGFTTYRGTVTAASAWGSPPRRKRLRSAAPASWEALLHETGIPAFLLPVRGSPDLSETLTEPRLERAVGAVYPPWAEALDPYVRARLAEQFDAVVHVDRTRAVEPLDDSGAWSVGRTPRTFPTGL